MNSIWIPIRCASWAMISSLALAILLVESSRSYGAQDETDDARAPAFFQGYLTLVEELDESLSTKTTYRFKVDGASLVEKYNERLQADMQKTFTVKVKDLDVVGKNLVRIEFDAVEGVSNDMRIRADQPLHRLVIRMDEDEAYLVEIGSKVAIRGTPRIMFRPSPNQQISRSFQQSVIAGWERGGHTCFLLIDGAQGSRAN